MFSIVFQEHVSSTFDFELTARSHGWVALRPFQWTEAGRELCRIQRLRGGQVVRLKMRAGNDEHVACVHITVESGAPLGASEEVEIRQGARRMLRLDEDLSEFYGLCQDFDGWNLKLAPGGGRLLRCPTLFEDIVYTLCTTNISWSGTIRMVDRLVAKLGDSFPEHATWRAFPTPQAIASAGPGFLKNETGLGYRSEYVWELASTIVEGRLDLQAIENSEKPSDVLFREIRQLKGVGSYAAATILMLLGRYEYLAIDSELRAFASKKYFQGEPVADAQLQALYAPWGKWQYLAYWFDPPA